MIEKTFDEIVLFARTGLNPRKNFKLGEGTNKYITIKNIHNNKILIDNNTDVVNDEALRMIHKRSQIKKGDILFCSIGRMGDMYIIPDEPDGWDINESVFAFTLNTDIIRQKYFYYIFKHKDIIDYLSQNSSGSTFKSIKMNQLKKMVFKLPSLEKQDKIISILDNIFSIIECRNIELQKLDELIKARFVEMFDEYSKIELYKIADITMGQSPSSSSYNKDGNGLPFFQGKGDYGNKYTSVSNWTTEPNKIVEKGTVLMSVRAPVGPVNIANVKCCLGRGLCGINAVEGKTNNEFLYNALKVMEEDISSKGTGSTFKAITKKDVYELLVPNVPLELQNDYSLFSQQVDKSREIIQKKIDAYQELFDKLMQEYFG